MCPTVFVCQSCCVPVNAEGRVDVNESPDEGEHAIFYFNESPDEGEHAIFYFNESPDEGEHAIFQFDFRISSK